MSAVMKKSEMVFLNFLFNRYNIPIKLVKQTNTSDIYMGEIRCKDGSIAVAKFEKKKKDNSIFTVFDKQRRAIYQCMTLNTEGRTKSFLDKMVFGR